MLKFQSWPVCKQTILSCNVTVRTYLYSILIVCIKIKNADTCKLSDPSSMYPREIFAPVQKRTFTKMLTIALFLMIKISRLTKMPR